MVSSGGPGLVARIIVLNWQSTLGVQGPVMTGVAPIIVLAFAWTFARGGDGGATTQRASARQGI